LFSDLRPKYSIFSNGNGDVVRSCVPQRISENLSRLVFGNSYRDVLGFMKRSQFLLLFPLIFIFFSSAPAKDLKKDMALMMQWFEGRFDNFAQTQEEKESKAEFPHEHIHSIFARVNLPAIGENVFYVQQYMDGNEAKIYRQRLYVFSANKKEKAIELKIYTFADEKAVVNRN
jgi:hypothetical protein